MKRIMIVHFLLQNALLIAAYCLPGSGDVYAQNADSLKFMKAYDLYESGEYTESLRLYLELYESGPGRYKSSVANNLGRFYQFGRGTKADYCRAFDLYLEAAEMGNVTAMNNLTFLCLDDDNNPAEREKMVSRYYSNPDIADLSDFVIKWQWESAKKKNPQGMYELAWTLATQHLNNQEYLIVKDERINWLFHESAELGYGPAQLVSGVIELLDGHVSDARKYFEKALAQDSEYTYNGSRLVDILSLCSFFNAHPELKPADLLDRGNSLRYLGCVLTVETKDGGFVACAGKDVKYGFLIFSPSGNLIASTSFKYTDYYHYDDDLTFLRSGLFRVSIDEGNSKKYFFIDINDEEQKDPSKI